MTLLNFDEAWKLLLDNIYINFKKFKIHHADMTDYKIRDSSKIYF